MILKLTDTLTVFADRYFTSIPLSGTLFSSSITLTGTIMAKRIPKKAEFLTDTSLKKSSRGSHDQLVRKDGNMNLIKWFNSKPVHLASSWSGVDPVGLCRRWSKVDSKCIERTTLDYQIVQSEDGWCRLIGPCSSQILHEDKNQQVDNSMHLTFF
ncbi:hypothetical protein JTB14_020417 [Gonioctena quinquepunctata]|nr:hypothetical protein JTB14_020417 [Gonioctena quinquepunctata]